MSTTKTRPSRFRTLLAAATTMTVVASVLAGTMPAGAAQLAETGAVHGRSGASSVQQDVRRIVDRADAWTPASRETTRMAVRAWSGRQGHSASGLQLDLANAQAFETPDGTVLRIPFAPDTDVLAQSNVSAVVKGNDLLGWSEMVLTPRSAESGRLQTWTNGVSGVDRLVEAAEPTVRSSWWSRFSSCLNSAGVAAWAITALSIACSAACVVTAGVGCIACLTAASAVTSGTISFCAGKASRG
jgi:hypothetical protein